jgi:hypothetical protein
VYEEKEAVAMTNQHTVGEGYTVKLLVRLTPTMATRVAQLAYNWHVSKADAIRIAIEMTAADDAKCQRLVALLDEASSMLKGAGGLGTDDDKVTTFVGKIEAAVRRERK